MFERFTEDARAVVVATQEVCRDLAAPEVGPVHLLLAMTEVESPAREILADRGVTRASVAGALHLEQAPPRERRPLDEADAEALRALGIDLDAIRAAVERQFGEGALDATGPADSDAERARDDVDADDLVTPGPRRGRFRFGGGHIGFGKGARKTLELAVREAIRSGGREIRVEHVALGLLRVDDDLVRQVLWQLSVDAGALRADLEGRLRRSA